MGFTAVWQEGLLILLETRLCSERKTRKNLLKAFLTLVPSWIDDAVNSLQNKEIANSVLLRDNQATNKNQVISQIPSLRSVFLKQEWLRKKKGKDTKREKKGNLQSYSKESSDFLLKKYPRRREVQVFGLSAPVEGFREEQSHLKGNTGVLQIP